METTAHRTAAKAFGIFFILSFLSYGLGSGLIASITSAPDILSAVQTSKSQLTIGIILMAVVHTFTNIALPVIMLPILKPYNQSAAYGYLGAAIIGTVVLIVGAIFLAMLVPLSNETTSATHAVTMANLLTQGANISYQLGMAIWGLGGLMLCYLLYRSNLIPRLLPIWGVAGYIIFIAGTMLELFGYKLGTILSAPGGLFEIALSVWLIFRGFTNHKAR